MNRQEYKVYTDELKQKAYDMGKSAFGIYSIAPANNASFLSILPNCSIDDSKGLKLRNEMYVAYRRGWTKQHVDSIGY